MHTVNFLDTTLRDGEQTPGVSFTRAQKLHIAKMADMLGVDIIEAGIPAMGKDEMECISAMLELGLNAQILTWNRLNIADIDKSIECGAKNIHIAVPVSDLQIDKKLGKTRSWVLDNMQKALSYCIDKNCTVSVGAEDASRADRDFLISFYEKAAAGGACRLRYADTVGIQDPFTVYEAISEILQIIDVDFEYHGHNDFGMSTANAYAAYKAGANVLSCTINGLGERAGNTPLEEIVMAIKHISKEPLKINTKLLAEASQMVEKYSKRALHEGKAITGRKVFTHESGIHVDGLIKDERMYQPYRPEEVGRVKEFVLGKFSGRKAIKYFYGQRGHTLSETQVNEIMRQLKEDTAKSLNIHNC